MKRRKNTQRQNRAHAGKGAHKPMTVGVKRAVIDKPSTLSDFWDKAKPEVFLARSIIHGMSRAELVRAVATSDGYMAACKVAEAAGNQVPSLANYEILNQWRNIISDTVLIEQAFGVTVIVHKEDADKLGIEWPGQADYLLYEDARRFGNWKARDVYSLTLENGRKCNGCGYSHYGKGTLVGYFYGPHGTSGIRAAVPAGYKLKGVKL